MASAPNYEGAKRSGAVIIQDTNGTTATAAVLTASPNGTRIKEIRVHSRGTAPGSSKKLAVIIDDGTNAPIIDVVSLSNAADVQQAILR